MLLLPCPNCGSVAHKFCGIIYPTKVNNKLELREMQDEQR